MTRALLLLGLVVVGCKGELSCHPTEFDIPAHPDSERAIIEHYQGITTGYAWRLTKWSDGRWWYSVDYPDRTHVVEWCWK